LNNPKNLALKVFQISEGKSNNMRLASIENPIVKGKNEKNNKTFVRNE
jgi:hypothetical protein